MIKFYIAHMIMENYSSSRIKMLVNLIITKKNPEIKPEEII